MSTTDNPQDETTTYECEGCGEPTSESEEGFLWFFGKPYCPECREAMLNAASRP